MRVHWSQSGVAALVVVVLLVTGPVGVFDVTVDDTPTVDEGSMEATVVAPGSDPLVIEPGRFGTGVSYLRMPDLVADVESVTGTPRLHYEVRVPALDVDVVRNRVLQEGATGRVIVPADDRALAPEAVANDSYRARIVVSVQRLGPTRELRNRTVSVAVRR